METKFITSEDRSNYERFFAHHIRGIASRKKVEKVCHYTSGETLIRIIQSGELWSTQIGCLNDSKEMLYAVEALTAAIAERRKREVASRFEPCLNRMEEQLRSPSTDTVGVFVTCFSSKLDDLSQWRAYGGSAGYAIVFDLVQLRYAAALRQNLIVPVLYGKSEADTLLNDAIAWAEKFYLDGLLAKRAPTPQEWTNEFVDYWLANLVFYAPMIKDEAFKDEEEWRLIYHLRSEDDRSERFLQRRSMMTIHLPIRLRMSVDSEPDRLPIDHVIVGPTGSMRRSQVAVGDLLRSKGYAADDHVKLTAIPYRPYL